MRSILQYWEHKNHTHMTITVKLTIYYFTCFEVYEYTINNQPIMWDRESGKLHNHLLIVRERQRAEKKRFE